MRKFGTHVNFILLIKMLRHQGDPARGRNQHPAGHALPREAGAGRKTLHLPGYHRYLQYTTVNLDCFTTHCKPLGKFFFQTITGARENLPFLIVRFFPLIKVGAWQVRRGAGASIQALSSSWLSLLFPRPRIDFLQSAEKYIYMISALSFLSSLHCFSEGPRTDSSYTVGRSNLTVKTTSFSACWIREGCSQVGLEVFASRHAMRGSVTQVPLPQTPCAVCWSSNVLKSWLYRM